MHSSRTSREAGPGNEGQDGVRHGAIEGPVLEVKVGQLQVVVTRLEVVRQEVSVAHFEGVGADVGSWEAPKMVLCSQSTGCVTPRRCRSKMWGNVQKARTGGWSKGTPRTRKLCCYSRKTPMAPSQCRSSAVVIVEKSDPGLLT